jgi:hypothetical protein
MSTVETEAKWGLKENIAKGSFVGWFVRLVIQEIFVLPWLL